METPTTEHMSAIKHILQYIYKVLQTMVVRTQGMKEAM
jgi:hypothetical protein